MNFRLPEPETFRFTVVHQWDSMIEQVKPVEHRQPAPAALDISLETREPFFLYSQSKCLGLSINLSMSAGGAAEFAGTSLGGL